MKKLIVKAVGIVALAAATGCVNVYRVSEAVSAQDAVMDADSFARRSRKPVAVVKANPTDVKSASLAAVLRTSVEADLSARGFDMVKKVPGDSVVALSVTRREKARLDEWRTDEGSVEVRVTETATGKLLGVKSFTAVGQRTLDDEKSVASVGAGLSPQITAWLAKTLIARKIPLAQAKRKVMMLTICPDDVMADPAEVLSVQRRFMDVVAARPGIISCRLAQEVPANRSFVFRVEYEPESFPGGLLNTIVLENPKLGDVRLKIVR